MMNVVTQNAALLTHVHSYNMLICQVNSAFNLFRLFHNFTAVLCFFTDK